QRPNEPTALWQPVSNAGIPAGTPPDPTDTDPVVDAAIDYVARSSGALAIVPLEDIIGSVEQPNLPGTIDQHPNWRRRYRLPADQLFDQPAARRRLRRLNERRRGRHS